MILLARHGETDWNRPPIRVMGRLDVPLNERGREQARALARTLKGTGEHVREPIAHVRTSHLRRARETAAIVAAELGLELEVDERLAESDRGAWQGRLLAEIERDEPDAWRAWRRAGAGFRFPGGESLAEHSARVAAALAEVARGPLPALCVCHGGTIRCAVALTRPEGLDAFHGVEVPNALVVRLDPARLVSPEAPA